MSGQQHPEDQHPEDQHPGERHPDASALAEYRAGLTGGLRGRRLAAHVASCARCASVSDQLATVSSALASAPAPPMPDAVERRITAALATEAAATPQAAQGGDASSPQRPPRRARGSLGGRRFRPAVVWSTAAAACVAVLVAVFLLNVVHFSSGATSSTAASSAGSAPFSGPVAAPAAGEPAGGRAVGSAEKTAFTVTASGTRYQPATLAAQVSAQLAAKSAGHASPTPASAQLPNASSGTAPSPALTACVLHLTGEVRPSLVDKATYQGKPAYVIAVPGHAWVVGTDCTASDPRLITSIGL